MENEQWDELKRSCVIVGECLARAAEVFAAAMTFAAFNFSDAVVIVADSYEPDPREELLRAIERMKEAADIGNLADYADDLNDIITAPKLPRPPKRTGPVNKANYSHNRPQRQARSSCRVFRR